MIYLDNAATTWPKPESVVRRARAWFGEEGSHPGRSPHRPGTHTDRVIHATRERMARLVGTSDADRIALVPGCTYAVNQAMRGLLEPGDHVVTTALEHNAVARPLVQLEEERGIGFTAVDPGDDGVVRPEAVVEALRPGTRLVALTHASNVLGTVQPVEEIAASVRGEREREVRVLVDAAQTAGILPLEAERWGIDLLAVAGHKGPFGLQGTGGLYVRPGLELRPLVAGGTGSRSHEARMPEEMPDRLEAGTAAAHGLAALDAGLGWLEETGLAAIREREGRHFRQLMEGLRGIGGLTVYTPERAAGPDARPLRHGDGDADDAGDGAPPAGQPSTAIALFNIGHADPAEAALLYDRRYGMIVNAGLQCAPWAHRWIGTLERRPRGAIRVSPGAFTTDEEIERFLEDTRELVELLG